MQICVDTGVGPTTASSLNVALTPHVATLIAEADENRVHLQVESDSIVNFGGSDVTEDNGYLIQATGYNPLILTGAAATPALYGFTPAGGVSVRVLMVTANSE